jgi:CSLREA domain-containing protein
MRRTTLRLVFLVAATASLSLYGLAGMQTASAATITVDTTADEFDSAPDTGCALREAIQAANTDAAFGDCPAGDGADTIVLPAGVYELDITGGDNDNELGDLDIEDEADSPSSDVTIQGAGAPTTIIAQTVADERVINLTDNGEFVVTISGVTVTGGDEASSDGGGIDNDGQTVRLFEVHVTANHTEGDGGGIDNDDDGVLVMKESAITANTATDEGGGLNNDGEALARLTNVTVSGNEADAGGGGISQDDGDGVVILLNVTVTNNTADADDGGFGNGGGLDQDGDVEGSSITITNTIVAGNFDLTPLDDGRQVVPDCEDTIVSGGHNLIGDDTGCAFADAPGDLVGSGAAPIDPLLGPLALNGGTTPNHELLAGSPAIDAGHHPDESPPIDQRSLPRDALPDIGAFEVQAPAAAVTCKGKAATIVGTPGNDVLVGTAARDIVSALAGKDKVKTKGGKDLVCAGKGKDRVRGGGGNDKLLGQGGNDRLKGAGGNDKLRGGKGKDRCNGGPGTDKGSCEIETNIP